MSAKKIRKKSKQQESRIAKDIGGKVTIASGALYFQKADVRSDEFLIEAKTTDKSFYSLNINTWLKVEKEALRDNLRTPLMHIQTDGGDKEFVVMSHNTFVALSLDNHTYYNDKETIIFTENKSFRIKSDILTFNSVPKDFTEVFYPRQDVRFVDYRKHLVILDWNDFLLMLDLQEEI